MASAETIRDITRRVAVEDLPQHLATLEEELGEVEAIEVVRGERIIAELRAPALQDATESDLTPMPDFMARLHSIWGDTPLDIDMTAIIREDRDGRG